ncbi:MAG: tyrosine-protein phosphatase [Lachnospiraceae bacterium]|nr:tyrosine-protein phosphatase [Lachnospiraceae bacterium]
MKYLKSNTILSKIVIFILFWALIIPAVGNENAYAADSEVTTAVKANKPKSFKAETQPGNISKYGNVGIPVTCEEFLAAGYEFGDIVKVKFLGTSISVPFVSNFSDIDSGDSAMFALDGQEYLFIAVNMGDFATSNGIAVKTVNEDGSFTWNWAEGVTEPVKFKISLKKAGGYYNEYVLHKLSSTNEREDYAKLSDEEFANFREVTTTGMGKGVLYRTSSPINPRDNRNAYADAAIKKAGVTVMINLADDENTAKGYEGYEESYYSTIKSIELDMTADYESEDFRAKLAEGLRFIAGNPGVYAVNCTEGKDRAGFVTALLECLMGASYEEVADDYMVSFYNYYGVTKDDKRYEPILSGNLAKTLKSVFTFTKKDKKRELSSMNLAKYAKKYFKSLGLTSKEIKKIKKNLSAAKG